MKTNFSKLRERDTSPAVVCQSVTAEERPWRDWLFFAIVSLHVFETLVRSTVPSFHSICTSGTWNLTNMGVHENRPDQMKQLAQNMHTVQVLKIQSYGLTTVVEFQKIWSIVYKDNANFSHRNAGKIYLFEVQYDTKRTSNHLSCPLWHGCLMNEAIDNDEAVYHCLNYILLFLFSSWLYEICVWYPTFPIGDGFTITLR